MKGGLLLDSFSDFPLLALRADPVVVDLLLFDFKSIQRCIIKVQILEENVMDHPALPAHKVTVNRRVPIVTDLDFVDQDRLNQTPFQNRCSVL